MTTPLERETELRASLAAIAAKIDPTATGVGALTRLSGGATQEIWRFALQSPAGDTDLILRRAPGGDRISGAGVGLAVEARLLAAAATRRVPVPAAPYVLSPEDGLGEGFVMTFVEGETLGGRIVKSDALATARESLARDCGVILARIHAIDPAEFPSLPVQTPGDLVEQWRDAYRTGSVARPVFEFAFRWLAEHAPPAPDHPRLVHGDFRNGNLMIGPDGVRAVLDWELAHVGDPMEDLGWLCVNSWRFGRSDKPVGGFGDYEDLYAGYEAAGGAPVDRAAARWWEVLGTIRWGVICANGLDTFQTVDPTIERAMIARRASETEIDLLTLLAN
jgi:aminoglycoside phosphotransferase (APT) family kinase protein